MKQAISNLGRGDTVMILQNGEYVEHSVVISDEYGVICEREKAYIQKRMHSENVSVYTNCEADQWMCDENDGYLSTFDADTRACFVNRDRPTFTYGDTAATTISRKVFLLTRGEVENMTVTDLEPSTGALIAKMIKRNEQNINTARICYNESGTAVSSWLASPGNATNFYCVYSNGGLVSSNASSTNLWLRPALNVAKAAIVTDNNLGTGIWYLDPEGQDYYEVEFEAKCGEIANRPKNICVQYDQDNLYDISVEVCNNYGDNNPVWQDATSQETIAMTNTSKETENWIVGIRCSAKSAYDGGFSEPVVKVEV